MSRLEGILKDFTGLGDVDDVYQEVLGALSEGGLQRLESIIPLYIVPKHLS